MMKALSLRGIKTKGNNANNSTDIFEYDLNSSRGSRSLAIVNLNASFENAGLSPRCYTGQMPEEFNQTPRRTSPIYSQNSSYIMTNNNTTIINSVNNSFVYDPVPSPIECNNNSGTFYSNSKRCVSIPTTPIVPMTTPTSEDGDSSFSDEFLMASTTPSRAQSATSSVGGRRFTPKKSARKPLDIQPKEHVQLFSTPLSVDSKRRNSVSGTSSQRGKINPNNMSTQSIDYLKHQPPPESPRINSARGISRRVQSANPAKSERRPSTPTVSFKQLRPPSSSSTTSTAVATPSSTASTAWKPNVSTTSLPTPKVGRNQRRKSFSLNPSLKSQLEAIKSVPLFLTDDIDPSHKSVKDNVSPLFLNQVIESLFVKEDKLVEKARLYNEFKEGEERIDRQNGSTPRGGSSTSSSTFNKNSFYPSAYKAASLASVRVEKENLMMENPFLLRKSQAGIHMDHFGVQAPISSRSLSSSRASIRR